MCILQEIAEKKRFKIGQCNSYIVAISSKASPVAKLIIGLFEMNQESQEWSEIV